MQPGRIVISGIFYFFHSVGESDDGPAHPSGQDIDDKKEKKGNSGKYQAVGDQNGLKAI